MGIEKLIERLSKYSEPVIAYKLDADFAASITDAISELRGKCDGCSVPATTAEMIRDLNDAPKLRAENEKLRAELEQVIAERGALIEDFVDYVTDGVSNPAIFCKNRCNKCVDMRGWCTGKNCKGFYPSVASGQKED